MRIDYDWVQESRSQIAVAAFATNRHLLFAKNVGDSFCLVGAHLGCFHNGDSVASRSYISIAFSIASVVSICVLHFSGAGLTRIAAGFFLPSYIGASVQQVQ